MAITPNDMPTLFRDLRYRLAGTWWTVGDYQAELAQLRWKQAPREKILQVLNCLLVLDGIQRADDYDALASHYVRAKAWGEARYVLRVGLAKLRGQPHMGAARQDLRERLARIPRSEATPPEESQIRRRAPVAARRAAALATMAGRSPSAVPAARACSTSGNAGAAETSTRGSAPALAPMPALGAAPFQISVQSASYTDLLEALAAGRDDGLVRRRLALVGHQVAMADRFDRLLCLERVRGVEHLPHQIETVRRVLRVMRGRALLADEVGLGKTIEAGMVLSEYLQRSLIETALILVPAALLGQWREELANKFEIEVACADGAEVRRCPETFWSSQPRILASLELARNKRHCERVLARSFDLVVVDEAHRLKRSATAGYRLVNRIQSRFLLLLTATPVETRLEELYNIITLLKPGQLSTRAEFSKRFVAKDDPAAPRNPEVLRQLLGEVMVRNTRALVDLKLPPRFASTVRCELDPAESERYERLHALVARSYAGNCSRMALATLLQTAGSSPEALQSAMANLLAKPALEPSFRQALAELAHAPSTMGATSKTQNLLALLDGVVRAGDKAVVFTRYRATLASLQALLMARGLAHVSFASGMTSAEKDAAVAALQGDVPILLATEVGGEGRNLQCANTIVNFDLPWNPMKLEQRIGRLHRIGQTREVRIYNFCAAGTAEDRMLDILDHRINMFELVVGELDMILGHVEDERSFAERILEIYGTSPSAKDLESGFTRLGDALAAARAHYDRVKKLDQCLFGDEYEA
jgi:superfamily II DNA or RNA helicase